MNTLERRFADMFCGCGGLSLGLSQAAWRGVFAIERDEMAFKTFSTNFLELNHSLRFDWPRWLDARPWDIKKLLKSHERELRKLQGSIHLIAGGPPCQGFSFAGSRNKLDPRNMLFKKYVEVVDLVRPELLLVENVPGMRVVHDRTGNGHKRRRGRPPEAYSLKLYRALSKLDYDATWIPLDASDFGVPQRRPRLVFVAVRRGSETTAVGGVQRLVELIETNRLQQLKQYGLSVPVSCKDAISDLETSGNRVRPCKDPASAAGYLEPAYSGPRTNFQRLMRGNLAHRQVDSARLARHSLEVRQRFERIQAECRRGVAMHARDRLRLGLRKHRIHPMSAGQPAPTVTTLPDDILHYEEPRILTVRESARLQSFPDWFIFRGKYTTGGKRRVSECPRYTQVGNAVPPLLGRAIGMAMMEFLELRDMATGADRRVSRGYGNRP